MAHLLTDGLSLGPDHQVGPEYGQFHHGKGIRCSSERWHENHSQAFVGYQSPGLLQNIFVRQKRRWLLIKLAEITWVKHFTRHVSLYSDDSLRPLLSPREPTGIGEVKTPGQSHGASKQGRCGLGIQGYL